jgi:myo-inositol-1(or 4)-monophosphatase|tara:strand:- start:635 stop:1357 length:723 start_codon:yes stop_codon:yes gene_type:complete
MIIDNNFFIDLNIFLSEISKNYILPNLGKVKSKDVKIKSDSSKATIHDEEIEELLINYFTNKGFNSFIAEETFPINFNDKDKYLTLDPIDGTRNFINGVNKVAIMISYIENNKNIFSIIHNPINNDFYHLTNNTIFKNFKIHNIKNLNHHMGYLSDEGIDKYSSIIGNYILQNRSSSIGYDMIQILEGDRSFLPLNKGKIWDIFPVLGFLENINFNSLNKNPIKFDLTLSDKSFFYYAKI